MATRQKNLGTALENQLVQKVTAVGIPAKKQPLSGVLRDFPNDVVLDNAILAECKVRAVTRDARGAKMLPFDLDWLTHVVENAKRMGYRYGVVVSRPKNSGRLLVTMEWELFLELLQNDHKTRAQTGTKTLDTGG